MSAEGAVARVPMPPGIRHVYTYECFNAASWTVVLGSPMLLYFQRLHAPATVLALAAGLAPLMSTLQIPAAPYVERIGYRRFVVNGWTARSLCIIGMALVAFLPGWIDATARIAMMLLLMLVYNTLRGISLSGLMPWFTHIVPESRRGEFLAKDQLASAAAIVAALGIFSLVLGGREHWYSFGAVYSLSAICAFISVRFLRRVPDVEAEKIVPNPNPPPLRSMIVFPPFQRYMRYNIMVNLAMGSSSVFWVRFFRQSLHMADSYILLVSALTTTVLGLALYLVSSIIDRTGSRPALTLSGGVFVIHFSIWTAVAAGLLPASPVVVILQCVISGFGGALWNLANLRAVIGLIPVMGRAHFLALYSVGANLTVGLTPLLWGPVLDALGRWHLTWGWWTWNSFTLFYMLLVCATLGGLLLLRHVREPESMDWDEFAHELLVATPARAVSQAINRFRGPGL